ncbi:MAG: carboxypeptidase regulatory-like domain-containing protein [Gemmatimonadota bacterium]
MRIRRGRGGEDTAARLLAGLAAGLLFTMLPAGAAGQSAPSTILGTALAAGSEAPVPGAEVRLLETPYRATTGEDGRFRIPGVEPGTYLMEVSYLGSTSGVVRLRVQGGDRLQLTITIFERVVAVEELKIDVEKRRQRGRLAGFYERRAHGFGWFITGEELQETPGRYLNTVFYRVPGVTVTPFRPGQAGGGYEIVNLRTQCPLSVYLDGARLADGSSAIGIETFPKEDIAAIEVYRGPSEIPLAYRDTRSPCGVILLWTRAGVEAD